MNISSIRDCLDPGGSYELISHEMKKSAVMVLLQKRKAQWNFVLIIRAKTLSLHGGETAFAGGGMETIDDGPVATALRELNEELAVSPDMVTVLGVLPFVMTMASGYAIVPVVGILDETFDSFRLEPAEVDELLFVPLDVFNDEPQTLGPEYYFLKGHIYHGKVIWGATYKVIREFLKCVKNPE